MWPFLAALLSSAVAVLASDVPLIGAPGDAGFGLILVE